MNEFQQAVSIADHERRIDELEKDMKAVKPIVYDTASSVKQIEKSVEKMEKNSDKIKGYFFGRSNKWRCRHCIYCITKFDFWRITL